LYLKGASLTCGSRPILKLNIDGFCTTQKTKDLLSNLRSQQKLRRCKIVIQTGGLENAVTHLAEGKTPNLLILESEDGGDTLMQKLELLAEQCSAETSVMLVGPKNDISLYKRLLALGITDYFSDDSRTDQLVASIETAFSDVDPAEQARVAAFIGSRGGVGSSVVAANTAFCMAHTFKERVTLVDLDIAFGTSALELNIDAKQTVFDALDQPERLDDSLIERFMIPYDEHLSILTAPAGLVQKQDMTIESIEILLKLVRAASNFVVLDLPHVWQNWVQELLLRADETILTSYPDLAGIRNTKNIFEFLDEGRGVDAPSRLIFNQIGASKKTELNAKACRGALERDPFLSIPYDPAVFGAAMNDGELMAESNEKHKITQKFEDLGMQISGRAIVGKRPQNKSILSLLSTR